MERIYCAFKQFLPNQKEGGLDFRMEMDPIERQLNGLLVGSMWLMRLSPLLFTWVLTLNNSRVPTPIINNSLFTCLSFDPPIPLLPNPTSLLSQFHSF